jgi:hypothetical protein
MPDRFQSDRFPRQVALTDCSSRGHEALISVRQRSMGLLTSAATARKLAASPPDENGGALPNRRYEEMIEEGLEHSRAVPLAHRMGVRMIGPFTTDDEKVPRLATILPLLGLRTKSRRRQIPSTAGVRASSGWRSCKRTLNYQLSTLNQLAPR